MKKFKEAKINDFAYFNHKSGSASIIKTDNNINYFVPAKKEMQQLTGVKKPIVKYERFIISSFNVLKKDNDRVIRIELIRECDSSIIRICENNFHKYFCGF